MIVILRRFEMLAKVNTFALSGLEGYKVDVEVDLNQGLPGVEMVGLASASVREAKERIRSAIKNVGYTYPLKRITVNLAPADTRKDGSTFDLPIAVGILAASEQMERSVYKEFIIMGELSLNGELRKIDGVLPLIISKDIRNLSFLRTTLRKPALSKASRFMRRKASGTWWNF